MGPAGSAVGDVATAGLGPRALLLARLGVEVVEPRDAPATTTPKESR